MRPAVVAAAAFAVALVWWPLLPLSGVVAMGVHLARPVLEQRARERRCANALPEVIDLVMIALSSGETLMGALRLLVSEGPPAVHDGVDGGLEHLRAGGSLGGAFHLVADELGHEYRPLMLALAQADREGSSLGALLVRLADEASAARRRRSELAARQLPVQMLFPLVLCSLPAVVLGAVVPLALVSLRRL